MPIFTRVKISAPDRFVRLFIANTVLSTAAFSPYLPIMMICCGRMCPLLLSRTPSPMVQFCTTFRNFSLRASTSNSNNNYKATDKTEEHEFGYVGIQNNGSYSYHERYSTQNVLESAQTELNIIFPQELFFTRSVVKIESVQSKSITLHKIGLASWCIEIFFIEPVRVIGLFTISSGKNEQLFLQGSYKL
jgi:hypothetical protein